MLLGVPGCKIVAVGGVALFFVRVNQVLVRLWACRVATSDRIGVRASSSNAVRFKGVGPLGSVRCARVCVRRVGVRGSCCVLS